MVLVFLRQLYFTGVQSAGIVMLLAALVAGGFVLTFEATLPIGVSTILELLATLMIQVLGVVFTLLIMGARSLSAISAEMAMVQVTGERSSLERLGVNTRLYLLLPRVLAPAVSGAVLYLYFVFTALLVGALAIAFVLRFAIRRARRFPDVPPAVRLVLPIRAGGPVFERPLLPPDQLVALVQALLGQTRWLLLWPHSRCDALPPGVAWHTIQLEADV